METPERKMKRCYVRFEHKDIGDLQMPCGHDLEGARHLAKGVNRGHFSRLCCAVVVKVYAKSKP